MQSFRRLATGGLAAGLLVLIMSGCATTTQPKLVRLVWPPPPETERIKFVRTIVSDEDLGKDTTFSQKLMNFLGGDVPAPNRIVEPMGVVASDDSQRVYISDFSQQDVFIYDFQNKKFRKIEDISRPMGLALDAKEQLYVVEQMKKDVVVFSPQGQRINVISDPSLVRPSGVAIDRQRGKIYVVDTGVNMKANKFKAHDVKVFDMKGKLLKTIGKRGSGNGEFLFPTYAAVDPKGNLYVTDTLNARVQMFDPDGKYLKTFGSRGSGWGQFDKPKGVALDTFGNVYVADSGWSNIQIFNQKGQILLFFGGRGQYPGMLMNPTTVAIDKNNRIYVADYLNHRVDVYDLVNTKATDSNTPEESKAKNSKATDSKTTDTFSKMPN